MAVRCPQCQSDNLEDSSFCRKCGSRLPAGEGAVSFKTMTLDTTTKLLAKGSLFAGKYRILGELGHGGMGIVYEAEDIKLKRFVALKFLPLELARHKEAKERFIREAQAAAALDHPNICTIHEVEEADGLTYIAMAYIEGQTLRERIVKHPLEASEAVEIAAQIAEGLDEAHRRGIVHRDVKSSNVMITEKGQAKIMDFGLAKVAGGPVITTEAKTMGTVAYMSPEQARGEETDERTDIWSLGIIMYEMLTGRLPFQGERETSVLYSIVHEEPKPLRQIKAHLPVELQKIIDRALKKSKNDRYASAAAVAKDLKAYADSQKAAEAGIFNLRSLARRLRRPRVAVPAAIGIIVVVFLAIWFVNRQAKIRWAEEVLMPRIGELIRAQEPGLDNLIEADGLVQEAERYLSGNPQLAEFASKCSVNISVETEPAGARISFKKYSAPDSAWTYLGISPLKDVRLPMGIFRWKMEKEGFATVQAVSPTFDRDESRSYFFFPYNIRRVLDQQASLPAGMVRVLGGEIPEVGSFGDFFIDQYEVTNKQFKEFVDKGGYQKKEYWKHPFIKDGRTVAWEQGIAEFVDQTGRHGPATWQAGSFPPGKDDYPVSGVSWYEAAAFAEFAGKSLPTRDHWDIAKGTLTPLYRVSYSLSIIYPLCNFQSQGAAPAGGYQGTTAYGAYDMAGNVREWCSNETPQGRLIRGGAWDDINYMFEGLSQAPAFDRSPKNGFRCVRYLDAEKIPFPALQLVKLADFPDFYRLKPVPDSIFQVFKDQFSYDKTELNARVEERNESAPDWSKEKVTFDAAYQDERVIAYLFLPKDSRPPFQTVIYFPGSSAMDQRSSRELEKFIWFDWDLSFILKDGRAVMFPVYKGTFEREAPGLINAPPGSRASVEFRVQLINDLRRCIDYLETRADIDRGKIAYLGFSWGAYLGTMIPALEERLRVSILKVGGLASEGRPEISSINYVTRVKIPTLMLNGRYDLFFPFAETVQPMFDLLGTPKEDKVLKLYDTDHFIPYNEFVKETLAWLDKYFGRPVK